ncbi:MAG: type II toxin-antitoxin system RelE/ParE family toxin [Chitinophagaceae bacterium]|nr:type II toxin-antitoxin system RelE/ParE family toxin [Chitinophagaceae bacterium]
MIVEFNNAYLQKIFEGKQTAGKPRYNQEVILKFKKTVLMLKNTESIKELRKFRGLNFEALKADYKGYYSVRVDYHYRLILSVEKDSVVITDVLIIEDLTNHYQ